MTAGEYDEIDVHGVRLAYRSTGSGPPVVFLHGNPTSSYLWRNVLEPVSAVARCVALDLAGMGRSAPSTADPAERYRFADHRRYVDGFFDTMGLTSGVTLVGHDWGGVLAVDWARRHPGAVRGIAYLETLIAPVTWDGPNAPAPELFRKLRGPEGEQLVLEQNVFVETVLPSGILRTLRDDELAVYRAPYEQPGESRRPTLTWAREIPIDGTPADVHDIVAANATWMAAAPVPKLFINAEPGALLTGPLREQCRRWPHQREVTVAGLHFLPEDSAADIAAALLDWLPTCFD
ncbi:haloalkane dehalogenase [Kribbella pittospori]|uniref:Haloalkane dehalogenase n=1 Tax=Kribbella pittospori TaxID=722689 RepID=A0A4R0KVF8_9ACTN|nr:haloalkane dehalogenase [Kribbella pittospori]TCC64619.1 haloalkane dehalogenase [Kribbella pittospori]